MFSDADIANTTALIAFLITNMLISFCTRNIKRREIHIFRRVISAILFIFFILHLNDYVFTKMIAFLIFSLIIWLCYDYKYLQVCKNCNAANCKMKKTYCWKCKSDLRQ